jgi:hypothetical protein
LKAAALSGVVALGGAAGEGAVVHQAGETHTGADWELDGAFDVRLELRGAAVLALEADLAQPGDLQVLVGNADLWRKRRSLR